MSTNNTSLEDYLNEIDTSWPLSRIHKEITHKFGKEEAHTFDKVINIKSDKFYSSSTILYQGLTINNELNYNYWLYIAFIYKYHNLNAINLVGFDSFPHGLKKIPGLKYVAFLGSNMESVDLTDYSFAEISFFINTKIKDISLGNIPYVYIAYSKLDVLNLSENVNSLTLTNCDIEKVNKKIHELALNKLYIRKCNIPIEYFSITKALNNQLIKSAEIQNR